MGVPAALVVNGDVRDAALDQPPRDKTGLAESVAPVALAQFVFFLARDRTPFRRHRGSIHRPSSPRCRRRPFGRRPASPVPGYSICEAVRGGSCCRWSEMPGATMPSTANRDWPGRRRSRTAYSVHPGNPPPRSGPAAPSARYTGGPIPYTRPVAFEERNDGADTGINVAASGRPGGLDHVGGRLMAVVAVGHAANHRSIYPPASPVAAAARRSGCRPRWSRSACRAARNNPSRLPVSGPRCRDAGGRPTSRSGSRIWLWLAGAAVAARERRVMWWPSTKPAAPRGAVDGLPPGDAVCRPCRAICLSERALNLRRRRIECS